ncbi:hypothetical protein ACWCQW_07140 [Streptomyces mirabilis]
MGSGTPTSWPHASRCPRGIVRLPLRDLRYGARRSTSPARLDEVHHVLSGAGCTTGLSDDIDVEM